jgi:glycosyltransferase involved in cell wall biosynthesis
MNPNPSQLSRGTVALLTGGNGVFEDFLDTIGFSLDDFAEWPRTGWLFGYVDALRSSGWKTVLFCVSRRVGRPTRVRHTASGTDLWILPVWKAYHFFTRGMIDPNGWFVHDVFGHVTGPRRLVCFARKEITSYLATPIGAFIRELRHEGCTAILTQDYENPRFDICVLLGKLLKIPVFATFQGGTAHPRGVQDVVRPIALRAAGGLVIGAGGESERIIDRYQVDKEKVWLIPNPIDLDFWRPMDRGEARQALGVPLHSRIVIYHGRIAMWQKGLDVLLDAWEEVRAHRIGGNATLLVIGSGHDHSKFRERLDRIEWSGVQWVDRHEHDQAAMRRYLSAADLYVLPSRSEGFPVAPLEAMACGLPIIGTDIPAMLDILKHGKVSGGLVVRREDPRDLADAISRLLANPDLCFDLGRNARRNVEENYSIQRVGRYLDQMLSHTV